MGKAEDDYKNGVNMEHHAIETEDMFTKPFIMQYNIQSRQAEKVRLLSIKGDSITAVNFGPFDNGYLLLGTSSGMLLAVDLLEMEVILHAHVFDNVALTNISIEPTNMVFVSSAEKEMVALNLVKKETHYVYLELGKSKYCTIAYDSKNLLGGGVVGGYKEEKDEYGGVCFGYSEGGHPLRFCC